MAFAFWLLLEIAPATTQVSNFRQSARLGLFVILASAAAYLHWQESKALEAFRASVGIPMAIACLVVGSMGLVPLDSGGFAVNRFVVATTLTCWLCYGFTRLPTGLVALTCVPASVLTLLGSAAQDDDHVVALGVYLGVANLIGWIMSVEIERRERALFWSARQLTEATAALEEMARSASEAAAARKHVLAAVSHDLRQPVASLALYARLLRARNDVLEPAGLLGTVNRVEACISALSGNLDRLAELGGLRSAKAALPVTHIALDRVFDRIESVYSTEASRRGVRLVVRHPGQGCEFALSNEDRLWDVLSNLVGNALKFPALGTRSWVLIGVRRRGDRLVIEVRDNGIGIAPDDQRHVFEEYFQVANHARNPERGYGLGLSIVRETVARLPGHSIALASRPGRGTRFSLTLPVGTAARYADGPVPEPRCCESPRMPYRTDGAAASGTGERPSSDASYDSEARPAEALCGAYVLMIEDDDSMRDALGRLLEQWGVLVESAASGEEALQAATRAERLFEAIVSDFRLPDARNGLELIDEIRRIEGRRTPAILLSGEFDVEELRGSAPADVHVMAKPPDLPRLRELLSDFARGVAPLGA
ncbi:MAG: response regulator [Burkholderiaceae bacterium]|nr:response regulator [Burkholderiaceae bacterium]